MFPSALKTAASVAKYNLGLQVALHLLCLCLKSEPLPEAHRALKKDVCVLSACFLPFIPFLCYFKAPLKKIPIDRLVKKEDEYEEEKPDLEELDWWSKYYESLKELYNQVIVYDSCQ